MINEASAKDPGLSLGWRSDYGGRNDPALVKPTVPDRSDRGPSNRRSRSTMSRRAALLARSIPSIRWNGTKERQSTVSEIPIEELDASTDSRGLSFSILAAHLDKIGSARDIHIGEILPGRIRGNHYHVNRGEVIAVIHKDRWSLHWDTGHGTDVHSKSFVGSGAVAIAPPKNWSHAIRNDGAVPMWIIAISDRAFDRHAATEAQKDALRRAVVTDGA
jgi:hypothetical protein